MKNSMRNAAFAGLLTGMTSAAGATTVDFSTYYADSGGALCCDYLPVLQSHGDVAGVVNVTYDSIASVDGVSPVLAGSGGNPGVYDNVGSGYSSDGTNTTGALVSSGSVNNLSLQITIEALNGNLITSIGSLVAYWLDMSDGSGGTIPYSTSYAIYGDGQLLSSVVGASASSLTGWSTVVIQLGNDYNQGVQSFNYELAPNPVPVPPALLLLGSAIAGLFGSSFARRKPAVQA